MAVRCIAQRFERATLSALSTAHATPRCLSTHAERSVPELAAIFEAGAGGDADAFLRRFRGRNDRPMPSGPAELDVVKHAAEKKRRVEAAVLPESTPLPRDLVELASPDVSLSTPSLVFSTALKQCPVSAITCAIASSDDDEASVASSQSTEPVSDDESGPDDLLQADSEPEQPVEDFLAVEPTIELISGASDHDALATNEPVPEVVEPTTETIISNAADHDTLATNEPVIKTLTATSTSMLTQLLISDAAGDSGYKPAAFTPLKSTTVPTTTTTTKTTTATAPAASSPSPAPSRSRASSRPRLDQKLQPPSVLPSRSPPSSTPSSIPTRERTRSAVPTSRASVAEPTPSSIPRRDVGSRYMNFAHSDRFLEERQRNVARRQELAARSQQNVQTRFNTSARSALTSTATSSASSATREVASRLTDFENDSRWLAQVAENRARADRVRSARKTKATATASA